MSKETKEMIYDLEAYGGTSSGGGIKTPKTPFKPEPAKPETGKIKFPEKLEPREYGKCPVHIITKEEAIAREKAFEEGLAKSFETNKERILATIKDPEEQNNAIMRLRSDLGHARVTRMQSETGDMLRGCLCHGWRTEKPKEEVAPTTKIIDIAKGTINNPITINYESNKDSFVDKMIIKKEFLYRMKTGK